MRKYLKKQCLDMLDMLSEAHHELADLLKKKKIGEGLELLEQCQQAAITIGETIESSEGEGTEEVHALEQYCELLWQLSNDIQLDGRINPRQTEKKLKKPLIKVSNGIKNHVPLTREVVFLPYKASMWDSLESVWKKMDNDPDIKAVVIPIPYYDKNPDGSFREIHYDGLQFPKYVPITGYTTYDLEEKRPDAIYIHNPYDDINYVTSVHPDYYSSRLKDLTDELVYIPYYLLDEIDPTNQAALDSAEHFINVPGVFNAHRVIVQSENWKQAYINVLTKYTGEDTKKYWADKIEGTGSPKMERVNNLTEEDYMIPDDWKRLITKADGSRKKVIFYNTSVGAFLDQSEEMLKKIIRVFEIFKENAGDVVLLWRPHPLMESTLISMRPELWDKYKRIVEDYRASAWGIYDDTPELDRAIAVSDAYYGDWSSVVQLYKATGKPIMIQNCSV